MKVIAFLLLFGIASASFHEALNAAAEELVESFLEDMEHAPLLSENFGEYDSQYVDAVVKDEIGKRLKDDLDEILEKVKEALDKGKTIRDTFLEKIRDLRQQLKDLKIKLGDGGKELYEKIREKAREHLRKWLDKLGAQKRSVENRVDEALSDLNIRDILKKVRDHLKNNVDPELLKEKIEKLFDQGSEILSQLLRTLKEKGKRKLMILIDTLLDDDDEDERETRAIADYWERIKDYFKNLKIDLQEKYAKFGEWVKDVFEKSKEGSSDKMENIKAIAKEFLKHAKGISKEIAAEAGEFFKSYKEDLGNVWDEIKAKINEIKNRKD